MLHRRNFISGISAAAIAASLPVSQAALSAEMRDVIGSYREVIDPHLPPYNAKGDAVWGRNGTTDGTNRLAAPNYTFISSDVGKQIWIDVAGSPRTITAIGGSGDPGACTVSGSALPAGEGRSYLFGTDDTAAIQAALDDAQYSAVGMFVGAATQNLRADVRGRTVMMRSGRGYLVSNSADSFNAGKTAALVVRRRTALVGPGGYAQVTFHLAPGSYGDVVATQDSRAALANPSNPTSYVDFVTMAGFTVHGQKGIGLSPNALSGIMTYPSFNGYLDVDPQNTIFDVMGTFCMEHGLYVGGRSDIQLHTFRCKYNRQYGLYANGLVDAFIGGGIVGGNGYTGVRVNRSANCTLTSIQAKYNGGAGGTDELNCADFVFEADQAVNGKLLLTALDAQESRGSSYVFNNSGDHVVRGCRSQDAGQQNGLNNGTLPAVRSGVRLIGAGSRDIDLDFRVEAGVRAFSNPNFTGSSALAIDGNATGARGRVEVQRDLVFTGRSGVADGAKIEGPGVSNGSNVRVLVDGVALT